MNQLFQIGTFCFRIESADELPVPAMFRKFQIAEENGEREAAYSYKCVVSDGLPELEGAMIARRPDLLVTQTELGEQRRFGIKGRDYAYGSYQERGNDRAEIWVNGAVLQPDPRTGQPLFSIDPVFTSLFALERHLIRQDSLVLHCAYICHEREAILFSAPSETGKTTQADLWQKYRGSRTINGDRGLLFFHDGRLYVGGWPVCGTSEVCENISMPVKAIVMLSQAKENIVQWVKPREAFVQLYSQLTINTWNPDFTNRAMDLIEKIIGAVPVYHLGCTISEEAVECLERALYGRNE